MSLEPNCACGLSVGAGWTPAFPRLLFKSPTPWLLWALEKQHGGRRLEPLPLAPQSWAGLGPHTIFKEGAEIKWLQYPQGVPGDALSSSCAQSQFRGTQILHIRKHTIQFGPYPQVKMCRFKVCDMKPNMYTSLMQRIDWMIFSLGISPYVRYFHLSNQARVNAKMKMFE